MGNFARTPYEITKSYDAALRHKPASFARETGTPKALHTILVSPYGVKRNNYWSGVQAEITMDDLFSR